MTSHSFDSVRDKVRQPRKKGRYESAEAIEKKIDQAKQEGVNLLKQAEALDAKIAEARATGKNKEWINGWKVDAIKLREQATRKFEVRCKFLKEKLQVYNTEPLFGGDRSIPKVGSDKYAERTKQ